MQTSNRPSQQQLRKIYRNFCFTLNNYTEAEYNNIFNNEWIQYIIIGKEIGESGTPHLQGYIELKTRKSLKQLRDEISKRWHIEPRRGNQNQAIYYCMKGSQSHTEWKKMGVKGPNFKKDADYKERGDKKEPGKRSDLVGLKIKVLEGKSLQKIVEEDVENYQQLKFVEGLQKYCAVSHEFNKKEVIWLYGDTGTGKTKRAMTECPSGETFHALNGKWFDGYQGQKFVIIDELRAKNFPYDMLLKLLDGYQLRVEVKGSTVVWKPEVVYITTCYDPQRTYSGTLEHHGSIDQLLRRISKLYHCRNENGNHQYDEVQIDIGNDLVETATGVHVRGFIPR